MLKNELKTCVFELKKSKIDKKYRKSLKNIFKIGIDILLLVCYFIKSFKVL
jgi:hypothetical protein